MAEELAVAHMRGFGFVDARRTAAGSDGGIDVVSTDAVAQVKHLSTPVGGPDIQRFRGAAHGRSIALFYSSSGYTRQAKIIAEALGIGLFAFDEQNVVEAINRVASEIAAPSREPASDRTEEEIVEAELWETMRIARFRNLCWRYAASSGLTQDWTNGHKSPDPQDLALPAVLDLASPSDAIHLVLRARRDFLEAGRGLLAEMHRLEDRPAYRKWASEKQERDELVRKFPEYKPIEYEFVPLDDIQRSVANRAATSLSAICRIAAATSNQAELRSRVVKEAHELLVDPPWHLRGSRPSDAFVSVE